TGLEGLPNFYAHLPRGDRGEHLLANGMLLCRARVVINRLERLVGTLTRTLDCRFPRRWRRIRFLESGEQSDQRSIRRVAQLFLQGELEHFRPAALEYLRVANDFLYQGRALLRGQVVAAFHALLCFDTFLCGR